MPLHARERCCWRLRTYKRLMVEAYTWKFLILLAVVQCFINGIVYMAINDTIFPLFKYLGVEGAHLQLLSTFAMAPWSLKPILGILSDTITLGRYHKRYWMVFACICGFTGCVVLSTGVLEIASLVAMFFLVNFQVSFCDLLIEGQFAEIMTLYPATSSNIVTLKTICQQFGYIIALSFVGPLADTKQFTPIYIIALCFSVTPVLLLLVGFMPEKRIYHAKRFVDIHMQKIRDNKRLVVITIAIGLCGPLASLWIVLNPIPTNPELNRGLGMGLTLVVIIVGVLGAYYTFPRVVAHVVLYQVITSLGTVPVGTALDFFYTANAECLPGGPAFPYAYYITLTGTLSIFVGFLAAFLYQGVFSGWRFRNIILLTTALKALAGLFDLAMVRRWNIDLGIPDKVFYIVGEAILEKAITVLLWIPSSTIIGKVCTPGMEATTYAYLAGMSNLASTLASLLGASAIDWAGLQMQTSPCTWDNLWVLVLVGHIICHLVVGLPSAFLIPNTYQNESLDIPQKQEEEEEEEEEGQQGSVILSEFSSEYVEVNNLE